METIETSQFSTCRCEHCLGKVEFPSEHAGECVECPHCHKNTTLVTANEKRTALTVRMVSGNELQIKSILLCDEQQLKLLNNKKVQIIKLSGGVSTGLGSIGPLTSVVTRSLAIRLVESVLSKAAMQDAQKLLLEAITEENSLKEKSLFFDVEEISFLETPNPDAWKAIRSRVKSVPTVKTGAPPRIGNEYFSFVHNGEPFVVLKTISGVKMSVNWNSVESYICS